MANCKNCNKPLSFFQSIFSSICNECQKKVSDDKKETRAEISSKIELTQQTNVKIESEIKYSNLHDWWLNALTKEERNVIISIYHPFGFGNNPLARFTNSEIHFSSQDSVEFLSGLSEWFKKPEYRQIAYKIIKYAEELVSDNTPILDKHFLYQSKIGIYYRNRDDDEFALSTAIEACKQQIAISNKAKMGFVREGWSLPSHVGYKQLCIIMEKQKNYDEVIRLANEAKMHGWAGDWDKRIEKCMKKRARNFDC